jgi:hypothetical protein
MSPTRALALSLAIVAVSTITARAQTLPWPTDRPQAQPQAPWPGSAPPAQPMTMPAPGAPMGQPPGASAPNPACLAQFNTHREQVEKLATTAKAGSEKHVSREEMCKLVGAYAAAEAKWVKYSEDNMATCGIPKEAVTQLKTAHAHTMDIRKKICSAGPSQAGAPAAPSLSDALGTTRLPIAESEKRKSGGTLDTLTGNPLAR